MRGLAHLSLGLAHMRIHVRGTRNLLAGDLRKYIYMRSFGSDLRRRIDM